MSVFSLIVLFLVLSYLAASAARSTSEVFMKAAGYALSVVALGLAGYHLVTLLGGP